MSGFVDVQVVECARLSSEEAKLKIMITFRSGQII